MTLRGDGFALNEVTERRAEAIHKASSAFYNNLGLRKGTFMRVCVCV